jgi:hypothetical protein
LHDTYRHTRPAGDHTYTPGKNRKGRPISTWLTEAAFIHNL